MEGCFVICVVYSAVERRGNERNQEREGEERRGGERRGDINGQFFPGR